jgi:cytosine/adenosine deaminase-related metal-dependent hydrolase
VSEDLIIRSGHVVTMDPGLGDIPDGDVLLAGGRIAAVGPGLDAAALGTPRARELDARGMIVAPGLVETHWHLWNTLLRSMSGGMPGEDRPAGYFSVSLGLGQAFTDGDSYQGTLLACAEAINSGITTVHDWSHTAEFLAAGIRVGLSVDTTTLTGNADMFAIMKLTQGLINATAHQEFACTARQALALGTIEGARSLGLDAVTGSLTPGKRADIILVATGHPNLGVLTDPAGLLVAAAQPANVDTVLVDGQILKRGGALVTLDGERISAQAREALAGVRARAA